MMVRLAFSIATAIEPEILIVDEVLSAGDLAFQAKARERIRDADVHGPGGDRRQPRPAVAGHAVRPRVVARPRPSTHDRSGRGSHCGVYRRRSTRAGIARRRDGDARLGILALDCGHRRDPRPKIHRSQVQSFLRSTAAHGLVSVDIFRGAGGGAGADGGGAGDRPAMGHRRPARRPAEAARPAHPALGRRGRLRRHRAGTAGRPLRPRRRQRASSSNSPPHG